MNSLRQDTVGPGLPFQQGILGRTIIANNLAVIAAGGLLLGGAAVYAGYSTSVANSTWQPGTVGPALPFQGKILGFRGPNSLSYSATGGLVLGGSAAFGYLSGYQYTSPLLGQMMGPAFDFNSSPRAFTTAAYQSLNYTANGGLLLSGTASPAKARTPISTGGLVLAGSATYSFHEAARFVTPTGGIVFGGAGGVSFYIFGSVTGTYGVSGRVVSDNGLSASTVSRLTYDEVSELLL